MSRPVSMRLRPQPILIVAAFALGLILPWIAIPAGESATHPPAPAVQPASRLSVEQTAQRELARTVAAQKRLAPAIARAGTIAQHVERLFVFRETPVDLVVTDLPQSDTEYVLLVFQRDLLDATEPNADRDTRDRFFAMAGLAAAGVEDSLLLAQLPSLRPGS